MGKHLTDYALMPATILSFLVHNSLPILNGVLVLLGIGWYGVRFYEYFVNKRID